MFEKTTVPANKAASSAIKILQANLNWNCEGGYRVTCPGHVWYPIEELLMAHPRSRNVCMTDFAQSNVMALDVCSSIHCVVHSVTVEWPESHSQRFWSAHGRGSWALGSSGGTAMWSTRRAHQCHHMWTFVCKKMWTNHLIVTRIIATGHMGLHTNNQASINNAVVRVSYWVTTSLGLCHFFLQKTPSRRMSLCDKWLHVIPKFSVILMTATWGHLLALACQVASHVSATVNVIVRTLQKMKQSSTKIAILGCDAPLLNPNMHWSDKLNDAS